LIILLFYTLTSCGWLDRAFGFIQPISMMTGRLQQTIKLSKYQARSGWAAIFGRVLVGFLDANVEAFQGFDLIDEPHPGRSWWSGVGTTQA
jgi:hypothetical protein